MKPKHPHLVIVLAVAFLKFSTIVDVKPDLKKTDYDNTHLDGLGFCAKAWEPQEDRERGLD